MIQVNSHRRSPLAFAILAGALALSSTAAASSDTAKDSVRYSVRTPHSRIEAGAARIRIQASPDTVLGQVTKYDTYAQFMKRFEKSRVVGRVGDRTDVFMQVPILHGSYKISCFVRFEAPKLVNGEYVIEGHMTKGNVERLDATWRIRRVGEGASEVKLELLVVPNLPVPGSMVTDEVAYAADQAVTSLRTHVEKH